MAHQERIGRITPAGVITEFAVPDAPDIILSAITTGADGNLWFATAIHQIGRFSLDGTVTMFPTTTPQSQPEAISAGPDGNVWFTEHTANQIGRITPNGAITEFVIPTKSSAPEGITAGPDGNVWFTEFNGNKIGLLKIAQ